MSNINPQNIDGTYPIAGQDNNSQGFRDNFTNTVNNFTFAAAELTDLQTYAVLKGPLGSVGQSGTPTNTMNYTYITQPQLLQAVETKYDFGTISTGGSFQVDWTQGHFQTIAVSGTATMSFASTWPATNLYTRLRLQVTTANTTVLTLPSSITNVSSIQGYTSGTSVSLPTGTYVFEFATYNAGSTVTINDLLRNYNTEVSGNVGNFITANISGNLAVGGSIITYAGSGANLVIDPDGLADLVLTNNTSLFVLDATASTSTGTGAVQVLGGVGVVGQVNAGSFNTAGNILSAGAIHNALTVNGALSTGNISTNGTQVETGYQQVKPGANVAVTVNSNVNRVLLHPASTIISFGANVTLPNTQVNGTIISISSNVTIAQLAVVTSWPVTTVSPYGNVGPITPGTVSRFMYIAADFTWYKIA